MRSLQLNNRNAYGLLGLICLLVILASLIGIMFGHHWDESRIMDSARESFQTGNPLPGWYVYPSLPHDLATLVQFTKFFSFLYPGFEEPWKQHLMVRGVFILYSCLGIVFTFLLTRLLTKSNLFGLISAAFLAFSWEFGYHIRWIAPDSIMMANVIASVFFAIKHHLTNQFKHLVLACIFGGLALASKYPAGLVFIPLFLSGLLTLSRKEAILQIVLKRILIIGGLTSLIFLITTPGVIFHFKQVVKDLTEHIHIYQNGHYGHTLQNPPFDHLLHLLEYFSLAVFAPNRYLSFFCFLLIIPGFINLKNISKPVNLIWLAFPATYFVFFCFQNVFIVRNYQVLLPFLFVLAGLGFKQIWQNNSRLSKFLWKVAAFLFTITLAYNVYFAFAAAFSIVNFDQKGIYAQFQQYMKQNPEKKFYITKNLQKKLEKRNLNYPENAIVSDTFPQNRRFEVATLNPKREDWKHWKAYRHNLSKKVIGQKEINFNYYPNWSGYKKIVILKPKNYFDTNKNQY